MATSERSEGEPSFTPTRAPSFARGLLELDAAQVGAHRGVLAELFEDRRVGLVVHGAVAPEACARLVDTLTRSTPVAPDAMKHFDGQCFGPTLIVWEEALDRYLEAAQGATEALARVTGIPATIDAILSQLAGLPVSAPPAPDGRAYCPANVRMLRPDSGIALHCENETTGFPPMRELIERIDTTTQLSFYVLLQAPEAGGELRIEPLREGEPSGAPLRSLPRDEPAVLRALDRLEAIVPPMRAGDLLVFDAGRHYHRVMPVRGARPRWTLGAFVARSKDHLRLWHWS
ncbi:MAG: 2OG-Fe(II) oxygenase [Sandaracinaceae bacterium]|nr:2OG-Fe(II) oxygenase [Sandaracinaceae bacterium]